MNALWQVPVVVATLLAWLSTPPGTIADAAEREAVRRVLMGKATTLYTNLDRPAYAGTVVSMPRPAERGAPSSAPASAMPDAPPPAADAESWRRRAASIREAIARHEAASAELSSHITQLMNDVVARDDPFQQAELRDQLQVSWAEFDRVQTLMLDARQQLERLQNDARLAGVPIEWLR